MTQIDWLQQFLNEVVAAEIGEGFTIFGKLSAISEAHLEFVEADLHAQLEANSSRDIYAMETRDLGIRSNRSHLAIPRFQLVAISRLSDVTS